MKNSAFNAFLLLFYSQVLGLDPLLAGTALLISLVFDAVTDPLTGSISDSWRGRFGRRHPFMYAAALPMAVTFYFAFAPPQGLEQTGLFAWMLTWTVLARAAMTLYHVPHLALGAELSDDYQVRTRVVAWRNFFGYVGAAILFGTAFGVFMRPTEVFPEGQLNPAAYPPLGLCFGIAMGLLIVASALGTHSRIPHLADPGHPPIAFSRKRLLGEMREAIRNPSFRPFFFGLLLYFTARGVDAGLGIYMGTYFWKLGSGAVLLPIAGLVGVLVGTPIFALSTRRIDKKPMFMLGIIGFSVVTMLLPIAKLVGAFPAEGSAPYVPSIYFFTFVGAVFAAAALVAAGSMLADIADEHELETDRRQEGIFFGALSFSAKASAGIGSWLSGLALAAISFPLKARPEDVDPETVTQLALIYGPGVLVLVVIAIAMLARYSLTAERVEAIQTELHERRAARAAT